MRVLTKSLARCQTGILLEMRDLLLLASGGLDSTTLAYWLAARGYSVQPLFLDYGQHCVEKEWDTAQAVLAPKTKPPIRIDIGSIFLGSQSRLLREANLWEDAIDSDDLFVPYRTLLFFAIAGARACDLGLKEVYAGFINSNHAKELDCSTEFLNGLQILSEGISAVRFVLPFREWAKSDVVQAALTLDVPIGETFSCQVYSDVPCGACPNCVDRLGALEGVVVPNAR